MSQIIKENEAYAIEAHSAPGCLLSTKITVKPPAAQKAYQKAVKLVNKQISIPGFRKGHAPDQAVIGRYASYIDQEWKDILVNDAYQAVLQLTDIYPLNKEGIKKPKLESYSQEAGAIVQITYEHPPLVPHIDFSKLTLPTLEQEAISEEKLQVPLEELQRMYADWEKIEDRPVAEGDFVDISVESLEEEPPKFIVEDKRFEINDKRLPKWLKQLLIGMNAGESVESESALDEEAEGHIKEQFKPTKVKVSLHAIQKIILPEIGEPLAQKIGLSSFEELKEKLTKKLEQEAIERGKNRLFGALDNALLDTYPFDLPLSMVQSKKRSFIDRRLKELHHLPPEELKQQETELESKAGLLVDQELRLYFLHKQLIKQGKIALTNQELNQEVEELMKSHPSMLEENDANSVRELVSHIASRLLERKAKEYALAEIALLSSDSKKLL